MRRSAKPPPDGYASPAIRLSHASGLPVYRQIVDQIRFLIEEGHLPSGCRLPSSRLLASNLGVNRNTVALAYRTLAEDRYVASHRRGGMVVRARDNEGRTRPDGRRRALEELRRAVDDCLAGGLTVEEVASASRHFALRADTIALQMAFVECNCERATYFAAELARRLGNPVEALVLGTLDAARAFDVDLVVTTFFHLAEVRRLSRGSRAEVLGIVVGPHVRTLRRLAQIPPDHRIGILYSTVEQAELIRRSLMQAGLRNVDILDSDSAIASHGVDAVVIPSEMPELRAKLATGVETVEFGNILDEASVHMLEQVVDELRDWRASTMVRSSTARAAARHARPASCGSSDEACRRDRPTPSARIGPKGFSPSRSAPSPG